MLIVSKKKKRTKEIQKQRINVPCVQNGADTGPHVSDLVDQRLAVF